MSVLLTEEQVLDIHLNARVNGGRTKLYTLCQRHGITTNEAYSVLRSDLKEALKKAKKGRRFMSWEGKDSVTRATKEEISGSKQNAVLRKNF